MQKKAQQKSGGKKEKERAGPKVKHTVNEAKRVNRLLKKGTPKSKRAPGKESMDSQVNLAAAPSRPERVNSV